MLPLPQNILLSYLPSSILCPPRWKIHLRENCYAIIGFLEDEANSTLGRLELSPLVLVGRISHMLEMITGLCAPPPQMSSAPSLAELRIQHQITSEMSLLWSKKYPLSHPTWLLHYM